MLEFLLNKYPEYLDRGTRDFKNEVVKKATEVEECSFVVLHKNDRTKVGPATVFFSHAYGYPLGVSLRAMLRHARENKQTNHFYWYDPVSLNQHAKGIVPFATLRDTFSTQIKEIGEVLALLYPFNAPENLTRCWCLFEIVTALNVLHESKTIFALSEDDEEAFVEAVARDHKHAMRAVQGINSATSTAREKQDQENIHRVISESSSFRTVDVRVAKTLRDWQTQTARRLLELREEKLGPCKEVLDLKSSVSRMLEEMGEVKAALHLRKQEVSLREGLEGVDSPDLAASYINLGALYSKQGKLAKAEEQFFKCLAIREKVLSADSPRLATSYGSLGALYQKQGKLAKAEEQYLKCLAIREKVLSADSPQLASIYNNLGMLYQNQGKLAKAEEQFLKCLAINEKVLSANSPELATSYNNLGKLYKKQGKLAKAEEQYLKCLAIREKVLSADSPQLATLYNNLGMLYQNQDKLAKAEELYLKCLAIREKVLSADSPELAGTYNNLGALYQNQGKLAKAVEMRLK